MVPPVTSDEPDDMKIGFHKLRRDYARLAPVFLSLLFLIPMAAQSCIPLEGRVPMTAFKEGVSGQFKVGQIVEMETGKVLSFDEFIAHMASYEVIFAGEVHDNPEHHLIQAQILQALMSGYGRIDVGMEFFQSPQQGIIDRYLTGDITELAFIEEVDWERTWGFPYHYYRPLILLAKMGGSRLLALNAPPGIVKKVARGGLDSLDADEREKISDTIDLSHEAHRAYVRRVYEGHSHGELENFEFFYQAQCVWEDTMAHHLASYLQGDHSKIIVFAGNGHIVEKFGIPERTMSRVPVSMVTVMPHPVKGVESLGRRIADFIWLTGH